MDWAPAEWDNLLTAIESSLTAPDEAVPKLQIWCGLIAFRVHLPLATKAAQLTGGLER
ncbi:hypothetical protein AB0B25_30480 [Nocardia sp. NPDC049190]|uniref:hypothetical protein n=1 Tax=Nocardia sp. NPDC049190 TaxID=3155650 RepID=UPI0034083DAE